MGQNLGPLNIKDTYQDLVQTSGSVFTDGEGNVLTSVNITASYATNAGTASTAGNAGTAATATSASHALVADSATSATTATTATSASYVLGSNVDGEVANATNAVSSSYATTASYAENAGASTLQEVLDNNNSATGSIVLAENTTSNTPSSIELNSSAGNAKLESGDSNAFTSAKLTVSDAELTANKLTLQTSTDSFVDASTTTFNINTDKVALNLQTENQNRLSITDTQVTAKVPISASVGITGSLNGNADTATSATTAITATTATFADRLEMTATATSNEHPLVLRSINPVTGNYYTANYDSNLYGNQITYNPSTQKLTVAAISASGVISASAFNGLLTGTSSWALGSNYATEVDVINDNTNSTRYIAFVDTTTGQDSVRADNAFTYNPQNNLLSANNLSVAFDITADRIEATTITGSNALISSNLAIGGIPNVSQSIADAATSGGGGAVDTGSLMLTGSVSDATLTFTKGDNTTTFDLTVNNVANATTATTASYVLGSNVDGAVANATNATDATNADNIAVASDATNADRFVTFVTAQTGDEAVLTDAGIKYNPSTNKLTTTGDLAIGGIANVSASISAATVPIDTGSFIKNDDDTYTTTHKIEQVVTLTPAE